ncbi:MAG: hypothetical protein M5U25_02135 [Planctomycetota bacterium]|nr:hypothetical protein [Planctomycetota bacterium]
MTPEGKSAPRKRGRGRNNNRGGGGGRRKPGGGKKGQTDVMHEEFARQAEMARMEARREKEEAEGRAHEVAGGNEAPGYATVDDETAAAMAAAKAEAPLPPVVTEDNGEAEVTEQPPPPRPKPPRPSPSRHASPSSST